jgi:hypothetical protein
LAWFNSLDQNRIESTRAAEWCWLAVILEKLGEPCIGRPTASKTVDDSDVLVWA